MSDEFISIWVKDTCVGLGTGFEKHEDFLALRHIEIFLKELPYEEKEIEDFKNQELFTIQVNSSDLPDEPPNKYENYSITKFSKHYIAESKWVFIDIEFRIIETKDK